MSAAWPKGMVLFPLGSGDDERRGARAIDRGHDHPGAEEVAGTGDVAQGEDIPQVAVGPLDEVLAGARPVDRDLVGVVRQRWRGTARNGDVGGARGGRAEGDRVLTVRPVDDPLAGARPVDRQLRLAGVVVVARHGDVAGLGVARERHGLEAGGRFGERPLTGGGHERSLIGHAVAVEVAHDRDGPGRAERERDRGRGWSAGCSRCRC